METLVIAGAVGASLTGVHAGIARLARLGNLTLALASCVLLASVFEAPLDQAIRAASLPVLLILDYYLSIDYFKANEILELIIALAAVASICALMLRKKWEATTRQVFTLFACIFTALLVAERGAPFFSPPLSAHQAAPRSTEGRLPLVVHLIMDEMGHMGDEKLGQELLYPFAERGFSYYARARAPSDLTHESLPVLFGLGLPLSATSNPSMRATDFKIALPHNPYFHALQKKGYQVLALQSSYLQLCVNVDANCHTYNTSDAAAMHRHPDSLEDRLVLAANVMLDPRAHWILKKAGVQIDIPLTWVHAPATALNLLDQLEQQVDHMREGEAWVVHVLLPHQAWMLDSACQLRPWQLWKVSLDPNLMTTPEAAGSLPYEAYTGQARCAVYRVVRIIDRLDKRFGPGRVSIIVHGDHGARLTGISKRTTTDEDPPHLVTDRRDTALLFRIPHTTPVQERGLVRLDTALWHVLGKVLN